MRRSDHAFGIVGSRLQSTSGIRANDTGLIYTCCINRKGVGLGVGGGGRLGDVGYYYLLK